MYFQSKGNARKKFSPTLFIRDPCLLGLLNFHTPTPFFSRPFRFEGSWVCPCSGSDGGLTPSGFITVNLFSDLPTLGLACSRFQVLS